MKKSLLYSSIIFTALLGASPRKAKKAAKVPAPRHDSIKLIQKIKYFNEGRHIVTLLMSDRQQDKATLPYTTNLLNVILSHNHASKEFKAAFTQLKDVCRGIQYQADTKLLPKSKGSCCPCEHIRDHYVYQFLKNVTDAVITAENIGEVLHNLGEKLSALAQASPDLKKPILLGGKRSIPQSIDTKSPVFIEGKAFGKIVGKLLTTYGTSRALSLTTIAHTAKKSSCAQTCDRLYESRAVWNPLSNLVHTAEGVKKGLEEFSLSKKLKSSPNRFNALVAQHICALLIVCTEFPKSFPGGTAYKTLDAIGQTITNCGKEIEALYR